MTDVVMLLAPPRSYRLAAYLAAAQALGARPIVASVGVRPLVPDGVTGVQIDLPPDGDPSAALFKAAHSLGVRAVVATDDATVELACEVAASLDLTHNEPNSVRTARRKDLSRRALHAAGCPSPTFFVVSDRFPLAEQLDEVRYPCVVKPLAMSGSRGVIRCDSSADIEAVLDRVLSISQECDVLDARGYALVERFLPGFEVALEGMLHSGELDVLAIFDKPDPLDGPYFEETLYVTPSRMSAKVQAVIELRVREAVTAFGLTEGPVHAELRVHEGDATVLEIAARTIGGDCARLLDWHLGQPLEERVLEHALGRGARPVPPATASAGVLMLPIERAGTLRRVEGVLDARNVPGIVDVVIAVREGYELVPLPDGSSYLGFVFATGESASTVECSLREAHAKLNVVTAPNWRISAVTS